MNWIGTLFLIDILVEVFGEPLMRGKNKYKSATSKLFNFIDWLDLVLILFDEEDLLEAHESLP